MINRENFDSFVVKLQNDRRECIERKISKEIARAVEKLANDVAISGCSLRANVDLKPHLVGAENFKELDTFKDFTIQFLKSHGWECEWIVVAATPGKDPYRRIHIHSG